MVTARREIGTATGWPAHEGGSPRHGTPPAGLPGPALDQPHTQEPEPEPAGRRVLLHGSEQGAGPWCSRCRQSDAQAQPGRATGAWVPIA